MKIRNGFVSNSSSSSFMIPVNDNDLTFGSIYSLARYMIPSREWGEDDKKSLKKLDDALLNNIITKDTNLLFRSCNFDTYIIRKGYNLYVDTCNNHDYNIPDRHYTESIDVSALMENERFFFIEEGVFVTKIPYETCKKKDCYGEMFKADDGNKYCIRCQLDIFKKKKSTAECERKVLNIILLELELWATKHEVTLEEIINEITKRWKVRENVLKKKQ